MISIFTAMLMTLSFVHCRPEEIAIVQYTVLSSVQSVVVNKGVNAK